MRSRRGTVRVGETLPCIVMINSAGAFADPEDSRAKAARAHRDDATLGETK
jgi:hypothetical protein